MNEVPVPEYIEQRIRALLDEKLRIDGRIAELQMLADKIKVVKEPSD